MDRLYATTIALTSPNQKAKHIMIKYIEYDRNTDTVKAIRNPIKLMREVNKSPGKTIIKTNISIEYTV